LLCSLSVSCHRNTRLSLRSPFWPVIFDPAPSALNPPPGSHTLSGFPSFAASHGRLGSGRFLFKKNHRDYIDPGDLSSNFTLMYFLCSVPRNLWLSSVGQSKPFMRQFKHHYNTQYNGDGSLDRCETTGQRLRQLIGHQIIGRPVDAGSRH